METVTGTVRAPFKNGLKAAGELGRDMHTFLQTVIARNGLSASSDFKIDILPAAPSVNFIHTHRLNDIRSLNKFFELANQSLVHGGKFIGCFESKKQRKRRIFQKFPSYIASPFYYGFDVIGKRIIPKRPLFRKMYSGFNRRQDRVLSTTEVLGRLISCGFKIRYHEELSGLTYFYAEKNGSPAGDEKPASRVIVRLKRIGKRGQYKEYYKLRTMYPYSEYLQGYVYEKNGTKNGDKINNDFRITSWGKIMRRFWIDEIPMLINYFKGDLKLVGVRPISRHKFEIYPEWLQKKRIKYKPGLIPPFYADLPETVEEFMETERRYLDLYEKAPLKTDVKYFFLALFNILFKGARSK